MSVWEKKTLKSRRELGYFIGQGRQDQHPLANILRNSCLTGVHSLMTYLAKVSTYARVPCRLCVIGIYFICIKECARTFTKYGTQNSERVY